MSSLKQYDELEALVGLGNGFDLSKVKDDLLLIGGGVGIPHLYRVCKQAIKLNKKPIVLLGFRTKDDSYYIEEFKKLNIEVYVGSEDGSIGDKANVVDLINQYKLNDYDYCTCGPLKMMEAIYNNSTGHGLLSFEARMGCGFGACMGCSTKTKNGYKRICKEGPILDSEEVLWED
jgi:dihydroorotate dehydrogenase electron transfer subunit